MRLIVGFQCIYTGKVVGVRVRNIYTIIFAMHLSLHSALGEAHTLDDSEDIEYL